MKKNVLNSPRLIELRKKRIRVLKIRALLVLGILIILFVVFALATRNEKLNINSIVVSGNKVVDAESIESVAQEEISGSYLWVIPKTNFFLYPKKKILSRLSDEYKRLKDISVEVKGAKQLTIVVSERSGLYTWCGEELPSPGVNMEDIKCYFIDEAGYIFDQAPYFSGDVYFKFFGGLSGQQQNNDPTGATLTQGDFQGVVSLKDSISDMGLRPLALYFRNEKEMEFYLESKSDMQSAPRIVLNTDSDFIKLAENLQAAINTDPLKSNLKNKYDLLSYIDLRFGNKVYYRFR